MAMFPNDVIDFSWAAVGIVWLVGLIFTKRTLRAQSVGTRLFHLVLPVLGGFIIWSPWFHHGFLGLRILPPAGSLAIAGASLTTAGCAFAIWARITLGANWSGRITVKYSHELVTSGPYALTRHPIYTGLIAAIAGSVVAIGEWRAVAGALLFIFAILLKMNQEERLMLQTFPETYPLYRRRVKFLIPGIL